MKIRRSNRNRRRLLLAAILLGTVTLPAWVPDLAVGQATNWTNVAGGVWSTPGNWSAGVPVAGGTAQFLANGTYNVSLDTDTTFSNLAAFGSGVNVSFAATSAPRTLTLTGTLQANTGSQLTFNAPAATVNVSGLLGVGAGSSITLNGGTSLTTGQWNIGSVVGSAANFIVDGAGTLYTGSGTGTLFRVGSNSNASGIATVRNGAIMDLDNSATNVLRIAGNTSNTTGTFNVESGGILNAADITIGTPAVGTMTNSNGTLNLSGATSQINQAGAATLQIGAFSNNNVGQFNVSGGTFNSGTGQTNILTGSTIALSGGSYNANGNVTVFGTFNHSSGQFNLASGRTVEIQASGAWNGTGSTELVLSGGTLTAFGIVNTPSLQLNSGSIADINAGTVNAGALSVGTSSVNVLNTGFLNATGASTFSSGGSMTLSGTGAATFGGPLTLATGSAAVINAGTTFNQAGTLNVRGSLTAASGASYNFTGNTFAISSGGSFVNSNAMAIDDAQAVSVSGGSSLFQTSATALESGGTLTLNGGTARSNFAFNGGSVAFNSGTLNHTGSLTADASLVNTVLGPTATLGAGRNLVVDGTTDMESAMTLNGGRFSTGNLTGGDLLTLTRGTMQISGSTLSVGSGGQFGNLLPVGSGLTVETTNGQNAVVNSNGRVVVSGGTFGSAGTLTNDGEIQLASNLSTVRGGTLTNSGVIRGTGLVSNTIVNNAAGQIRANNGDVLQLGGASLTNSGRMEAIRGELQVAGAVQNNPSTGMITGRDGIFRFDGGLLNSGAMAFGGGGMDVFGEVINQAGGIINVSGGSDVTFHDDFAQNGTMQVVTVGNTVSTAVFFGAMTGGGFTGGGDVFALGDLRPGFSPASVLYDGNLFLGSTTDTFIELGGLGIGDFDQLIVTGDLGLAGSLSVALINGFSLGDNMQFLIGDVGGALAGQFAGLGEGDLVGNFGGQELFITYQGGDGNGLGLFTAVPEPGMTALAALGLVACALLRRSRTAPEQKPGRC